MWFKGVLTSEKLGTPIDSGLLIYCLQADHILSRIRVCIVKTPFSLRFTPLLLSTMDATSPLSVARLCTQAVVATPQPSDTLWWFVYMSLQSIFNLPLEISGPRSSLHLSLIFGLPAPSVSVPVSMTHCSVVLVTSHSGAYSAPVSLWVCPGHYSLVH
jgi:hypothetical protein